jgi:23S rRNA (pseudouridine1915-N3)-methyltransferase
MKIRIVTVGKPKLRYVGDGFSEYVRRLSGYHQVTVHHVPDRLNDAKHLTAAVAGCYTVALDIPGRELTSHELAEFLEHRELESGETAFLIGGPEGLPEEVVAQADFRWSLGKLTYPHDLAMVVLAEALYRASTISSGHPYHK